MSFSRIDDPVGRGARKNEYMEDINMFSGPPPGYNRGPQQAYQDFGVPTRSPRWYDVRQWRKRTIIGVVVAIVIVLVIIIAVSVVEVRNNRYPDYSQLSYVLKDNFTGTNFFDNFDYFSGYDPTAGFVHYLDSQQAAQFNLTYATSNSAFLKVDDTSTAQTTGRYSVRITSKNQYNDGLFIFDVKHSPYGCSTWPALWLTDPANWPTHGEIDVMEAVNQGTSGNQMTLHTTNDCSMSVKRQETGTVLNSNCYNGTDNNAGCGVSGPTSSFGAAFNAAGGGVMAMELRSAGIRMWQFARSSIPADITNGSPDPSTWGTAAADFPSTDCNIGSHFVNQSIIADIDLCGTWAGAVDIYSTQDGCPGLCTDFVANNASAYSTAFWEFGAFQVYQAS